VLNTLYDGTGPAFNTHMTYCPILIHICGRLCGRQEEGSKRLHRNLTYSKYEIRIDVPYSLCTFCKMRRSKNDRTMAGDQGVRLLLRSLLPHTDSTSMYQVQRQDTMADLFTKELLQMEQYQQQTYEEGRGTIILLSGLFQKCPDCNLRLIWNYGKITACQDNSNKQRM